MFENTLRKGRHDYKKSGVMDNKNGEYISALSYDFLTLAYDFIMQYAMHESAFKNQLVKQVKVGKG